MNRQQQIDLVTTVHAARAFACRPVVGVHPARPFRLTVVFHDGVELELHLETEGEAEGALQVLIKFFPEQIDLDCTGVEDMRTWIPPVSLDEAEEQLLQQ